MKTAQYLSRVNKIYIESFLPHILPILKYTRQFISFVHEIFTSKLDNNLRHWLDKVFLCEILQN